MNKALETVWAVHTHTSQFLNKRNARAFSYESAFCVAVVCTGSVSSTFKGILFFVNYIEDSYVTN